MLDITTVKRLNLWKICCFGFLLLIFGIAAGEVHSFDIFWQMQSGKYIWQTKSFLYKDTFSLASDVYRFEHCWLHDLIFYAANAFGGFVGVSLLKGFLVMLMLLLAVVVSRVRRVEWPSVFLVAPSLILLTFWAWKERPQLWSYLGVLLLILVFERNRLNKKQPLWLVFVVLIIWANLHAGFVIVFPVVTAYLVGELIDKWRNCSWALSNSGYKFLWLTALFATIAAFVTPYGIMPLKVLLLSPKLGAASGTIAQVYNIDWLGTSFDRYPVYYYIVGLVFVVLLFNWKKVRLADALLLCGLAYMGTKLERHTPFFLLASAALLPTYIGLSFSTLKQKLPSLNPRLITALVLLSGVAVTAYWASTPLKNYGYFNVGLREWHYPVEEATFVKEHNLPGNLFNSYGAGGYLMWRLYPQYRVFWDGRQDSLDFFQKGLEIYAAKDGWEDVLTDYAVNTLILESCSQVNGRRTVLLEKLRHHQEWSLVFAGESHLVFVRRGSVSDEWLTQYTLPVSRIDDTILSQAQLLLKVTPLRRHALWEIARVLIERGDYRGAFPFLQRYIQVIGQGKVAPQILNYYQWISRNLAKQTI